MPHFSSSFAREIECTRSLDSVYIRGGERELAEVYHLNHAILKTLYKPDNNYSIWLGADAQL